MQDRLGVGRGLRTLRRTRHVHRVGGTRYSASPSAKKTRNTGSESRALQRSWKSTSRLQLAERRAKRSRDLGAPFGKKIVVVTFHGGVSGSTDSPSRWMSNHTKCTCCRPDHADATDLAHRRIRARSWTSHTTRSASRRRDAHEAVPDHRRSRAHSSSNHNVCILSPYRSILSHVITA